jgi:hypothetical protein
VTGRHRIPCAWSRCECPHLHCDAGWIDDTATDRHGITRDITRPCEICRPEVARHMTPKTGGIRAASADEAMAEFEDQARRLRTQLPTLPRPSRVAIAKPTEET